MKAKRTTHKNTGKLPVSGSEPTCTKAPFGTTKGTISANCYQYAIQYMPMVQYRKLQPGNLSGKTGIDFALNTCHPAKKRVLEDIVARKLGYEVNMESPCAKGFSKIILQLAKNNDFHFLRQNGDVLYPVENGETRESIAKKFRVPLEQVVLKNGAIPKKVFRRGQTIRIVDANVWSGKRGTAFPPSLYDAKGNIIFDPRTANFNYGDLNYDKICSAFCVKQKRCHKMRAVQK